MNTGNAGQATGTLTFTTGYQVLPTSDYPVCSGGPRGGTPNFGIGYLGQSNNMERYTYYVMGPEYYGTYSGGSYTCTMTYVGYPPNQTWGSLGSATITITVLPSATPSH